MGGGPNSVGLVDELDALSRPVTWSILAVACLLLVAVDRIVPEVGMGPLYIPLIALAGWRLGSREACTVATVAALLNVFPHLVGEPELSPGLAAARGILRLGTYAFVVAMACALRRVYDRERTAARRDALTGVLNRPAFEEHARLLLDRRETDTHAIVLALADLDGFKAVNDTRGHAAGDAVLRAFSGLAGTFLADGDRLGRLGGDEFVLLLQAGTVGEVRSKVEALHRHLTVGLARVTPPVSVSLGAVAIPPRAIMEYAAMTREADRLMYTAKTAGKGSMRVETVEGSEAYGFRFGTTRGLIPDERPVPG